MVLKVLGLLGVHKFGKVRRLAWWLAASTTCVTLQSIGVSAHCFGEVLMRSETRWVVHLVLNNYILKTVVGIRRKYEFSDTQLWASRFRNRGNGLLCVCYNIVFIIFLPEYIGNSYIFAKYPHLNLTYIIVYVPIRIVWRHMAQNA